MTPLFVKLAVTLNTEVKTVVPGLTAVNEGTFPTPLKAARPMATFVLVQLYTMVPPVLGLVNTTDGTEEPTQ